MSEQQATNQSGGPEALKKDLREVLELMDSDPEAGAQKLLTVAVRVFDALERAMDPVQKNAWAFLRRGLETGETPHGG